MLLVNTFAECVAHEEDWYKTGRMPTVSQRLNNPCCLPHWKDRDGNPYPDDNGFAEFPTALLGWKAGRAQCRINILKRKLTFRQFFGGKPGTYRGFAPADHGEADLTLRKSDPKVYAQNVLARLNARLGTNADLDTPIFTLLSAEAASLPLAA